MLIVNKRFKCLVRFTLIEMLVVIAIIAILVSMLMPSLGKAVDMARLTACTSNMRQLGVAQVFYSDEYHGYIPPALWDGSLGGGGAWYEKKRVYFEKVMGLFQCPAESDELYKGLNYVYSMYYGHYYLGNRSYNPSSYKKYQRRRLVRISSPEKKCSEIDGSNRTYALKGYGMAAGYLYDAWSNKYCISPDRHMGMPNVLWLDGHGSLTLKALLSESKMR